MHSELRPLATSECYLRDVREWSAVDAMVEAFRHMEKTPPKVLLGEIGSVVHEQELAVGHCFGVDVHLWVWLAEPGKPRGGSRRKRR